MKVKNRLDLYSKFTEIMNNVYETRKDEQKQYFNQNMIKTYLIEGHINDISEPTHNDFYKFFNGKVKRDDYDLGFFETEEEFFFHLVLDEVDFYLDATNDKRFWILHTADKTENTDYVIKKMLLRMPFLDKIWLTKDLLEKTRDFSIWRGISLSHTEISEESVEEYEPESINLKITNTSERKVDGLINLLHNSSDFNYSTGIFRVDIISQEKDDSDRVLDDIRYDGKISTRGKSFQRHLYLTNKLYEYYKKRIRNIEQEYAINFNKGTLEGLPINIEFERKNLDVKYILKTIFSYKQPFNLWGYPKRLSDNYYKVYAIDLHSGNRGQKINFEVASDFITVYLPRGNCGNTIARLVCNIQLHLDSQIKVWGGDNNALF
jgi:hypothetical protein